ncbi:MAG: N-acetylmuramoyl-L-alanine amidase family protein, partial [Alphaproteobacteria bacterium]
MRLLRNNHRFAGFAVLKAPEVPSVLIEMGYLSNRTDERLLRNPRQQKKIAAAMVRAVNRYFLTQEARKRP